MSGQALPAAQAVLASLYHRGLHLFGLWLCHSKVPACSAAFKAAAVTVTSLLGDAKGQNGQQNIESQPLQPPVVPIDGL